MKKIINILKQKIKSTPLLRHLSYTLLITPHSRAQFRLDYKFFRKNYMNSSDSDDKIEYRILLLVHSLEKGFCYTDLRPFGYEKINELLGLLRLSTSNSSGIQMGTNMIHLWVKTCEERRWPNKKPLSEARAFAEDHPEFPGVIVGARTIKTKSFPSFRSNDYNDSIAHRHATRTYLSKKIKEDDISYGIHAAILAPSACNRQMVRIYHVVADEHKKALQNAIVGLNGFTKNNTELFVFTFSVSSLISGKERNQGFLNTGLAAMNFCNALHFRKIGTCLLQWANDYKIEDHIKELLNIPKSEKIAVIVGAGYYPNEFLAPYSHRRPINEILKTI